MHKINALSFWDEYLRDQNGHEINIGGCRKGNHLSTGEPLIDSIGVLAFDRTSLVGIS